jgi:hypothetical protein
MFDARGRICPLRAGTSRLLVAAALLLGLGAAAAHGQNLNKRQAKSEGWPTRKIRGKIERPLRVGRPPIGSSSDRMVRRPTHRKVGR